MIQSLNDVITVIPVHIQVTAGAIYDLKSVIWHLSYMAEYSVAQFEKSRVVLQNPELYFSSVLPLSQLRCNVFGLLKLSYWKP